MVIEIKTDKPYEVIVEDGVLDRAVTWATHVLQWMLTEGSKTAMWSKPLKTFSVQIAGCNPPA